MRATALAVALVGVNVVLSGCAVDVPSGVKPVTGFDAKRYMGTWYELARIDHSFEKDLTQVSASYSLKDDGSVTVLNRGFDSVKQEWREAEGKARFLGSSELAALKVSFFGPFYVGDYWVLDHADDYSWSIVGEPSGRYLWILSREARPPAETRQALRNRVQALGYDLSLLRETQH